MTSNETHKPTDEGAKEFPDADVAQEHPKETRRWPDLDALREREPEFEKSEFDNIDPNVPLLMLPVRLETRIDLTKDAEALRIRIFPDQLHIRTKDEALSELEARAGQHFWTQAEGADRLVQKAALKQLIETIGSRRAGHVVERTDPKYEPEKKQDPPTSLPRPELTALPERWVVIGYTVNGHAFLEVSAPVTDPLSTAVAGKEDAMPGDAVTEHGKWMIDYDAAVLCGMAITVQLPESVVAAGEITSLVVFGVDSRLAPEGAKKEINALFSNQERRVGVGFVQQGAPTNNTRGETTDWTHSDTDLDQILDGLFADSKPESGSAVAQLQDMIGTGEITALARAPNATLKEHDVRQAMNTVLFDAAAGRFIRELLPAEGTHVDADALREARRWFINDITGGAPVTTLRIGAQPYGILPVAALRRGARETTNRSAFGFVEDMVIQLREEWIRALDTVPLLDPNAIDRVAASERPASSVPALLASQPHPARLFYRRQLSDGYGVVRSYTDYVEHLRNANPQLYSFIQARQPALDVARGIDAQLAIWGGIANRVLNTPSMSASWRNRSMTQVNKVLEIIGQIEQRQRPLKTLDPPYFTGTLGDRMSTYLEARPDKEATEVLAPPLVTRERGEDGPLAQETLTRLAEEIAQDNYGKFDPPDLLTAMIVSGLKTTTDPDEIGIALEKLAAVDSPETLDLLARETLGLVTHRLDAWYSSLAINRIAAMRQNNTFDGGLVIGSYGWLADLKFDQTRTSNGFVHAPSLSQAATSAVARSGWLAHGGTDTTGPAAINADSSRIRLALTILQGVRSGQPLGVLLGYRFERRLRESQKKLGGFIRDIRQRVIAETGSDATEDEPVDGERLLELYRARTLDAWLDTKPVELKSELDRLTDVFDAIHDVSLFEGTHAATQGKSAHATAVFDSINQGTRLPPEYDAQNNPRSGESVDHRAMLLFPRLKDGPSDEDGWTTGVRDPLVPELERWLRAILPSANKIGLTVAGKQIALSDIGLSACDALYLMSEDPTNVSGELLAVAHPHFGQAGEPVPDASPEAKDFAASLEEVQLVGAELRALLDTATPLTASALRSSGQLEGPPRPDDEAQRRLKDLREALVSAIEGEDFAVLARFGIASGPLEARIDRALRAVELTAPGALEYDKAVSVLLGRKLPLCPSFTMPTVGSVSFPEGFKDIDGWQWLDKVGAVRPAIGRLTTARYLAETIGARAMDLHIGQDTQHTASEGWAAIQRPPPGSGGRLSVAACGDQGIPSQGDAAVGLMIDQWSERIPAEDQITGVAFHYDAPSSKPPQALLLATAPLDAKKWSMRDIAQVLFDTLQFSALRMVGPEDLVDFGAVLPTIYADLSDTFLQGGGNKE